MGNLKSLLQGINVLGEAYDVYVNGHGPITVSSSITLTKDGQRRFHLALQAETNGFSICDDDATKNNDAWFMLNAMQGLCDASDYKKWFGKDKTSVWTDNAIINLQYITAYMVLYHNVHWLDDFTNLQSWALEFSAQEARSWEDEDTDYESTIEAWCEKKYKERETINS